MSVIVSVTIIILLVYSIIGYKKGLVKTVLSFGSILVALFIANMAYGQVSKIIRDATRIDDSIRENISESISEKLDSHVNSSQEQKDAIERLTLPADIKKMLSDNNNNDVYDEMGFPFLPEYFPDYVGYLLSCVVVNGIAFLVTFFVVLIFCKVLLQLWNLATDFPLVGWVDSLGGLALGLLKGLILVWLVYFFVTMCSTTAWGMTACQEIQDNLFTKLIYDNNLLTNALYNLAKTLF